MCSSYTQKVSLPQLIYIRGFDEVMGMGLVSFIKSTINLLKLARKPDQKEYSITLRIVLLGIAILGLLTFIIRFVAIVFQGV